MHATFGQQSGRGKRDLQLFVAHCLCEVDRSALDDLACASQTINAVPTHNEAAEYRKPRPVAAVHCIFGTANGHETNPSCAS